MYRDVNIKFNKIGLEYTNNSKAWMTQIIFKKWLNEVNKKMKSEKRKILLILDNAIPHYFTGTLSNVEIFYLPAKTI